MTHYCNNCKLALDIKKERHIKVEDNDGTKSLSRLWYHKKCWHEIMTGKRKMAMLQSKADDFLSMAGRRVGAEEVFVV